MARREVIEITCDRCGKRETQEKNEVTPAALPEFQGVLVTPEKMDVKFEDLCRKCRETVTNYFKRIAKATKENGDGKKLVPGPASASGT